MKPAWKAWGCESCLALVTFGYLWIPLVTFPYLSFPYLSLPFLTFTRPYWALFCICQKRKGIDGGWKLQIHKQLRLGLTQSHKHLHINIKFKTHYLFSSSLLYYIIIYCICAYEGFTILKVKSKKEYFCSLRTWVRFIRYL